jgi:hypothetical protein
MRPCSISLALSVSFLAATACKGGDDGKSGRTSPMSESDLVPPEPTEKVAQDLSRAGYTRLFLAGDSSSAGSVWRDGQNRAPLEEIVQGERHGDLERVLASEVLYRYQDGYPPRGWNDTLGRVYARALAITGTGDRPIVLTGNLWGFLSYSDRSGAPDHGPLGAHLLEAGPAAVRHLVPLLDDPAGIFYEGSQDATLGNSLRYRVKDAAAYYIGKLKGIPVPFHEEPDERDAEIDRLKAAVAHGD